MKVTIAPSVAHGTVMAPPSKSMAHRALICGALSKRSTIRNIEYSQDIVATLRCLESMGAVVERSADAVTIGGLNPINIPPYTVLNCEESGSTLRLLLPLCLLANVPVLLTGSKRLLERPLTVYEEICRRQNLTFIRTNTVITVCGRLAAGSYRVNGDISSQFISGLMLALPLLEGDSRVDVIEPFESRPYVKMTQVSQSHFAVALSLEETKISIPGKQEYLSTTYDVEGDYSNAAYLEAFNLLGGDVKVAGLSGETAQGDRVYRDFYRSLKAGVKQYDLSDCPDLGPVLFSLAAVYGGAVFCGIARLRFKESDRIDSIVQELEKFGISTLVEENCVQIQAGELRAPKQPLCTHGDHRVAMALSLLCSVVGGVMEGAEVVAKSFPNYFDVMRTLGIQCNVE